MTGHKPNYQNYRHKGTAEFQAKGLRRSQSQPEKRKSGTDNFYLLTAHPNGRPLYGTARAMVGVSSSIPKNLIVKAAYNSFTFFTFQNDRVFS